MHHHHEPSSAPKGMHALPRVTRRATLGGFGAAIALGKASVVLGAPNAANRLVVINIRGGLDGLATVIPYGDPSLAGLRSSLVPSGLLKLDNFFALNPAMPNFYTLMKAKQAMAVHAVGPLASTRSHFAAQDSLQSGSAQAQVNGWLNRALSLNGMTSSGLAMSAEVPLVLRGNTLMPGWAPDPYRQASSSLTTRVVSLAQSDTMLGPAETLGSTDRTAWNPIIGGQTAGSMNLTQLATVAGQLMASSGGPRVAVLETDNFDSHEDQNDILASGLASVDAAINALRTSLGSAWSNTVVLTMTEFGRTAYVNGTGGTDHGTAFAVLLAGGAVNGGSVLTTWPGLTSSALYQGRDLAPTTDFRSVAMGLLISHLGISASAQQTVFPGSIGVAPLLQLTNS